MDEQPPSNRSDADPRSGDLHGAQEIDPVSGASDDPRVDPTPDVRQSETEHVEQPMAPDS